MKVLFYRDGRRKRDVVNVIRNISRLTRARNSVVNIAYISMIISLEETDPYTDGHIIGNAGNVSNGSLQNMYTKYYVPRNVAIIKRIESGIM